MANNYKNIIITPNRSSNTADPKVVYSGGNTTANTDITLNVYPDSNGTLSWDGSAGQLFSITNDLSNNLFGVNDVSGIPYLEVYANGLVSVAAFGGNVVIGNTAEFILSPGTGLHANGSFGTAGQALTTNGSAVYWSTPSAGVNTSAQYTWSNTQTFQNTITFGANLIVDTTSVRWVGNTTTSPTVTIANTGAFTIGNSSTTQTGGQISVQNTAGLTTINAGSIQTTTAFANVSGTTGTFSGLVNASSLNVVNQTNTATLFITTSANIASSNIIANSAGIFVTNTTGVVNAAVHQVGTSTIANSTGVYTGVVNGSSITVGTSTIANSTGVYTGVVNGSSHTVGTSFTANSTLVNAAAINITGQTNTATLFVTTSANIASSNVIANTAGLFVTNTTGVVNAAVHSVGTSFIANTTQVTISGIPLSANGSVGTAGQVLTTNGATGAPYWTAAAAGVNTAATYTWTNVHTYQNSVIFNSNVLFRNNATTYVGNTTGNGSVINLYVYPDSNGTLSWEGNAGQLFSITNDLSNNIFGVNDVSGIPSLEIYANSLVSIAPFGGNVVIGNTAEFILSPGTGLHANGSFGTAGQVLHSNGSAVYWAADDNAGGTVTSVASANGIGGGTITTSGTLYAVAGNSTVFVNSSGIHVNTAALPADGVTSVATGSGLTGGTITATGTVSVLANNGITANTTGLFVTQGTGTVVNSTGVHVNSAYIGTLSANNSSYLGGVLPQYYVKGTGVSTWGYRTTNLQSGAGTVNAASGYSSGFYDGYQLTNMPTSDWYHLIINSHYNSGSGNQYEFHIATAFWDTSNFYMRSISPSGIGSWRTLLHNGNYNSYAPTLTGTGASGTWSISINGSAGSAPNPNAITFNNGGAGAASGSTYTGSSTLTVSYNTVGAPSTSGTGASGTWSININGSAASATNASAATNATNFTSTTQNSQFNSIGVNTAASGTAGEIRATNNITAYYSDKRLKTIIGKIPNALEKVMSISGVIYKNNKTANEYGYIDESEQVGVIAQEIEKVLPQIVKLAPFDTEYIDGVEHSKSGENYKTVQYEKIIPLLIEAIKDQQTQIDELKKIINNSSK